MNAKLSPSSLWIGVLALLTTVLIGSLASADTENLSINDINLNFRECDGPLQMINLGDLDVTLTNNTPNQIMKATFDVDMNVEGSNIFDCFDLHWLQYITYDDCPATVAGDPAGSATLPFPVIDTPPNGWDYIYNDLDAPADGIQADERVPGNTTAGTLVDDANDTLPWYHTTAEEAMAAGSGNQTGGLGTFTPGETYEIIDVPGFCPGGGCTNFTTFLVAVPTHTCDGPDCLAKDEMLVLAGFDWVWSTDNEKLNLSETTQGALNIETALANTGFTGWEAFDSGTICCPEPTLLAMLVAGLLALPTSRVRNRKLAL